MKKIGVILSGCGVFDGAEIHESTLTLLALDQAGALAVIAAPDRFQARVYDHQAGCDATGERRNCMVEAARIARGAVLPVSALRTEDLDAAILPGGYGAALNLSDLATAGPGMKVEPSLAAFLAAMIKARKPVAALCIAPPILARAFADAGVKGVRLTIGNDRGVAGAIEALGQVHVECLADSCVVDEKALAVTCPAYMTASGIAELWVGIEKTVNELMRLTGS